MTILEILLAVIVLLLLFNKAALYLIQQWHAGIMNSFDRFIQSANPASTVAGGRLCAARKTWEDFNRLLAGRLNVEDATLARWEDTYIDKANYNYAIKKINRIKKG